MARTCFSMAVLGGERRLLIPSWAPTSRRGDCDGVDATPRSCNVPIVPQTCYLFLRDSIRPVCRYLTGVEPAECPYLKVPMHCVVQLNPKGYGYEEWR